MARDTVDDPDSRVRVARFEADGWIRGIKIAGWFTGVGSGVIVGALAYFRAPLWLTVGAATALVVLSIASILILIGYRLYVQNAYTEMTASHLETEAIGARERLERMEFTLDEMGKRTGPPRLE